MLDRANTTLRGPKPHWLTGNLAEFRKDRLAFFIRCAKEYGDIVPLRIMRYRVLLLSRPDLIEDVLVTQSKNFVKHFGLRLYRPLLGDGLVTAEGDHWRRQRKLSAPAFQASRIAAYAKTMVAATLRMLDTWQQSPGVRDVHDDLSRATMEIACATLFGDDRGADPEAVGRALTDAMEALSRRWSRPIPLPEWAPTPENLLFRRASRRIERIVRQIVDRKRAAGNRDGNDLLSALLQAQDENGSAFTDAQLMDEVRTLFLAGHETTALALTYSLHLLAENPDSQSTLQAEIDAVLNGRPPEYADMDRLPYTRNVVTESMRLYPPADFLGREAIADCTVGGMHVRKGTNLFMSEWVMHHDERYFRDAWTFDPDRWTPAFERSLPRFVYFPFGAGPRYCIGQTFATAEAVLGLAAICQRFRFAPDPTFHLELWPGITLRPRHGLRLIVSPRGTGVPPV
jgi:cytochrome P450